MLLGHAGEQGTSTEEVGGPPRDEHVLFSALWRIVLAALPVAFAAMVLPCKAPILSARLQASWSQCW